jgi:VWFA-related protein
MIRVTASGGSMQPRPSAPLRTGRPERRASARHVWPAEAGRSCDARVWPAEAGCSCDARVWPAEAGRSCDARVWPAEAGRSCDARVWPAEAGRSCGARVCGTLLVLLVAAATLAAQTGRPQPRFRAAVDLVMVDVSVLDESRQPVRGLAASKFTILEDGVSQEIVNFSEVEVPGAEALPTGWMRDVAPDVKTNGAAGSRIFLLVFDDSQVAMRPDVVAAAKSIGHYVVDRLGPDDLAAIVFTRDNRNAMDFTADRIRLRAMIDKFHGGGGGQMGWLFRRYSTGVLRSATRYLADVRDRRKVVIYVSPGVGGATNPAGSDSELYYRTQDAIREARRANIPFYPINPSGLVGLDVEAVGAAIRGAEEGSDVMQVARDAMNEIWDSMNAASDHLHMLASNTGGFVVGNTNTFAQGVAQIFRESASYYLLGFRPAAPPDGKQRRLEVRVDHPGVTVSARSGYSEPKPRGPGRAPAPTTSAISGLLPATDLPMRAAFAPFAIPGKKEAAVTVAIGLRRPAPAEPTTDRVRVLVHAFDPEGRSRASRTFDVQVVLRATGEGDAKYEALARIDLEPGRYQVRASAESASLARAGSVYAELVVPDFRKDAVSLSGVILTADPALPSAGLESLGSIVPVAPTTQREFAGHTGAAFVRVYQGGRRALAPVSLTTRIVDLRGDPAFERTETLEPERFDASRATDCRFDLPLVGLAPGAYLLTFEAALGERSATRDVRFVVLPTRRTERRASARQTAFRTTSGRLKPAAPAVGPVASTSPNAQRLVSAAARPSTTTARAAAAAAAILR